MRGRMVRSAGGLILLGLVAAASTASALPALFPAFGQDPSDPVRECEAAVQAADREAAVARCEEALAAQPDAWGLHYFLGFAYQAGQEWAKAAAAFESFVAAVEALAEDAERPEEQLAVAVRSAGVAWFRAGDAGRALPLLRRVAAADGTDAEAHFFLGVGLVQEGDPAGAELAFSVVAREAPEIVQAQFFLGRLRYEAGDYEAARPHLDRYLEADAAGPFRADAHWMAGSLALRQLEGEEGEAPADADAATEEARRHFTALVEAEPESARAAVAHHFLGSVAADREECEGARRHYEAFLRLAPDHERAADVRRYLEEDLARCGEG